MSSIHIAKGYPKSFLISLKNDTTVIDLNDGTWTSTVELRYQTKTGPLAPFTLNTTPSTTYLRVDLTSQQTTQLSHLGTGYILVVKISKNDNSVFMETQTQVNVTDGL